MMGLIMERVEDWTVEGKPGTCVARRIHIGDQEHWIQLAIRGVVEPWMARRMVADELDMIERAMRLFYSRTRRDGGHREAKGFGSPA